MFDLAARSGRIQKNSAQEHGLYFIAVQLQQNSLIMDSEAPKK